ncbi:MAG: hypothetical protein AAF304_05530 [Pseudomonadota bacterium]
MDFPNEWSDWEMYPDDLFIDGQLSSYTKGSEDASEHYRNGAFFWWLKKEPTKAQLLMLVKLTYLDPDEHVGKYVRGKILEANNCDEEIKQSIDNDWIGD